MSLPQYVEYLEKKFLWCAYWVGLGILSSVGLGTGLHTFLLYLVRQSMSLWCKNINSHLKQSGGVIAKVTSDISQLFSDIALLSKSCVQAGIYCKGLLYLLNVGADVSWFSVQKHLNGQCWQADGNVPTYFSHKAELEKNGIVLLI